MKNFDFNAFVAKAEKTKSDDLLKKIKGGANDNCHDGGLKAGSGIGGGGGGSW